MTNFEKIKQMTVTEMAKFMEKISIGDGCDCCECHEENCYSPYIESRCVLGRVEWLNQEAEQ